MLPPSTGVQRKTRGHWVGWILEMSALDNAISMLEHDLAMAQLGRIVDVNRVEKRLIELRKERAEIFAEWLDTIPKPTFTMPDFNREPGPDWELTAMGMDESQAETEERANRCFPTK